MIGILFSWSGIRFNSHHQLWKGQWSKDSIQIQIREALKYQHIILLWATLSSHDQTVWILSVRFAWPQYGMLVDALHLQYTVIVSIMRRASHKSSNNLITNSVYLGMKSRIKSKSLMEWWQFIFSLPVTDFVYFCLQALQQNNKPRFTTNLGTVYFFADEVPKFAPKQYGKSIFTWSVSQ